jgi:hypothetical protein
MIGMLLGGILFLVVDMVYDRTAAAWGAVASVVFLSVLLVVLPRVVQRN